MADLKEKQRVARDSKTALAYQTGFGNHFATEAKAGALPLGRNSPQKPPLGLYAEQISGTAFTAPRAENRRIWTYRLRPSVVHRPYSRMDNGLVRTLVSPTPFRLCIVLALLHEATLGSS